MANAFASLFFLALACFFFWLAHRICAYRIQKASNLALNEHIGARSNTAVALRFSAFAVASALGLCGPLTSPSMGLFNDVVGFCMSGMILMALLILALALLDRLVLPGVDNTRAILNDNAAVGLVEAGGCLATGLILRAAFSGLGSLFSGIVFFLLGQLALAFFFKLLERLSPYDDQAEIARSNVALGLHLGTMLVCLGLVLASAVSGDFSHWMSDLTAFAFAAVRGVVLLLAGCVLTDRFFLRRTTLANEIARVQNTAAVIYGMGVKIGFALLIAATA